MEGKIRILESITIIGRKRRVFLIAECCGLASTCGRSARNGKSSFSNYHSKYWLRQELPVGAKSGGKFRLEEGYLVLKYLSTDRSLVISRKKFMPWKN